MNWSDWNYTSTFFFNTHSGNRIEDMAASLAKKWSIKIIHIIQACRFNNVNWSDWNYTSTFFFNTHSGNRIEDMVASLAKKWSIKIIHIIQACRFYTAILREAWKIRMPLRVTISCFHFVFATPMPMWIINLYCFIIDS